MFRAISRFDWWLNGAVLILLAMSILNLYGIGGSDIFWWKHVLFIAIGIVVFGIFAQMDYRIFRDSSKVVGLIYFAAVFLLSIALGSEQIRGISAWIHIGNIRFEPSEFAKIALILLLAKFFAYLPNKIRPSAISKSFLYTGLPIALVLLQPDLGSALVLGALWLGVLIFSGLRFTYGLFIFGLFVVVAFLAWGFVLAPYQKARIASFFEPQKDPYISGFHTIQSQISVGAGGIFGSGIGRASQVNSGYLPEPRTDFAFAALSQQFGFVGALGILALYAILFIRMWHIATRARDSFAILVVCLFFLLVAMHVTINIGMNLGLFPITGLPLSFLSYGGSHLVILMAGLGIIQNIYLQSKR